ncbi:MAG: glucose-1-phosphate thymidylyltransferase [Cytophagaceae bacterium]|jgi:UDP-N-acetylglucosamine diphosphorylase/glucosamine-1-phosphate N-acetyltransferase|nr:glucose-1-phosphate thymidylyltransferase [Cytophagaceae bacterium]
MTKPQNIIFFDEEAYMTLLPLTFTRPAAELRCGILTITEKWSKRLRLSYGFRCRQYLSNKYPLTIESDNLLIYGGLLPNAELLKRIEMLQLGQVICKDGKQLVGRISKESYEAYAGDMETAFREKQEIDFPVNIITRPYHLVSFNRSEIANDFELITAGRKSEELSTTVTVVGAHKEPSLHERIFLESGAVVEHVMLNPQRGPIYIGRDTVIMEGSLIRGPVALCNNAQINLGTKVYAGTTLGPYCKGGGEINNTVMIGYSNKGHDGFVGDSVIGEWCNIGADTNTSNLKNDFAEVKLWDYQTERFLKTGLQFLGLVMGDFSRCGINTMFNSGTVIGVGCNIYGSGYPRNYIPSFALGGSQGFRMNNFKEICKIASIAMSRRNVTFSNEDEDILTEIFKITKAYRKF